MVRANEVLCAVKFPNSVVRELKQRRRRGRRVVKMNLYLQAKFGVYLGVKTCEVSLCFVAIVRVRSIMLSSLF